MAKDNELLQHLIELENLRVEGWFKHDKDILTGLMDKDFMETNYFGRLNRTKLLTEFFPNLTLEKFDMDDFKLLASGDNLAILSYKVYEKLVFKGNEVEGVFHVTAVYRNNGEKWLLLLLQKTPFMQN